jgi:rRNA processing protein Krr1/Pno1
MKPEDIMSLFEDDYVYEVIPIDDSKTNNQSSYQDSLLSGNNDGTIPLSQGHALSNCKIANIRMYVERRIYRFYKLNVTRTSCVW